MKRKELQCGDRDVMKSCTTVMHILFKSEDQHGLITLNIVVVFYNRKNAHTCLLMNAVARRAFQA